MNDFINYVTYLNEAQGISDIAEKMCDDIIKYFSENTNENTLVLPANFLFRKYGLKTTISSLHIEKLNIIDNDVNVNGQLSVSNKNNPIVYIKPNIDKAVLLHELTHFIHYIHNPNHTNRFGKVLNVELSDMYNIINISDETEQIFKSYYLYLFSDTEKNARLADVYASCKKYAMQHPEDDFKTVYTNAVKKKNQLSMVIYAMKAVIEKIQSESRHDLYPYDFSSLTALITAYAKISKNIPRVKVTVKNYEEVKQRLLKVLIKEVNQYINKYKKVAYYGYEKGHDEIQNNSKQ